MVTAVSKVVAQSQRSHSEVKVTPPHLAGDAGHVKRRPEEVAGGGVRGEVDPRDDLAPANRKIKQQNKRGGGRRDTSDCKHNAVQSAYTCAHAHPDEHMSMAAAFLGGG